MRAGLEPLQAPAPGPLKHRPDAGAHYLRDRMRDAAGEIPLRVHSDALGVDDEPQRIRHGRLQRQPDWPARKRACGATRCARDS